jgi:streptogrisin C
MQRRTVVAMAASVAAIGAAVAFTLPSMAGTTGSGGTPAAAGAAVSPRLLAAMSRDLGVTPRQAAARVQRATWAAGVASTLRTETGAAYAGSWLGADGTTLNVGVSDAAMAATVRAAGATPHLVRYSVQQLDSAKQALDAVATTADRALPGWYVDVAANKVAVQALPGQSARAAKLAAAAGVPAAALKVVTAKAAPRPLADVVGAQPYFVVLPEGTARCSIGFAVQGGFVTAGHCGAVGTKTFDSAQKPQGTVVASTFPGNADFGVVTANAGVTLRPFVDDFNGDALPVAGHTEAPVGAAICRSGSTTGTHCGVVEAKNQTVNYPEGSVTGLTQTTVCAEGGDSGGPWLSGDQAQGVTSGGSGDCTVGGETFFQPINEILQRNNLTLLTTAGGGSAPPSDGASTPPGDGASTPPGDGASTPPGDGSSTPPGDGASAPPADGSGATPPSADPPAPPAAGRHHRHHHH